VKEVNKNLPPSSTFPKRKGDCSDQQHVRHEIVPLYRFPKNKKGKHGKHEQGDTFLNDLELSQTKVVRTDPVSSRRLLILREAHLDVAEAA
jgi:hypothetical protein